MAFSQLTYRDSLRDIEACMDSRPTKVYHLGLRSNVSRSALADANQRGGWRIYFELAQIGRGLKDTVYALDPTTIDKCLSLFP